MCHKLYDGFYRSKYFEAMNAGKCAIRPWLSSQYNENKVMDLPFSVAHSQFCDSQPFYLRKFTKQN